MSDLKSVPLFEVSSDKRAHAHTKHNIRFMYRLWPHMYRYICGHNCETHTCHDYM